MNILIDNKGFTFGGHRFIYNLYFIEHESEYLASTCGETFKKILIKWSYALQKISSENSPLFLPFDPDDEWTDCLKATWNGEKIAFNFVRLAEGGWGVFDFDLEGFMTSPHEINAEPTEILGEFDKEEIVSALINAEVIDK